MTLDRYSVWTTIAEIRENVKHDRKRQALRDLDRLTRWLEDPATVTEGNEE